MEKGVRRWIVDISKWNPSPHSFSLALSSLPQHEHHSITRFMRMEDRKRALVSRLLQYAVVHEVLGLPYDKIIIKRTLEGKPYLESCTTGSEFSNFNFNVSHHGDYVAIASEPLCLVGVDIVCCVKPCKETVPEFIQNFTSYFTSLEWENIVNAGTADEILVEFYRYWCLKEAFVKALGSGLTYGVDKVEFHHTNWTNIFVKIDGEAMPDWKFRITELQNRHWVSVARGHPRYASGSYRRTLNKTVLEEEEFRSSLYLPNVNFVSRTIEELISVSHCKHGMVEMENTGHEMAEKMAREESCQQTKHCS